MVYDVNPIEGISDFSGKHSGKKNSSWLYNNQFAIDWLLQVISLCLNNSP